MLSGSILNTIKALVGIEASYTAFDTDLIVLINSAIDTLTQNNVGPIEGFKISGSTETWADFIGDANILEQVKEFIFIRAKIVFDPPANSFVLDAYEKRADELIWRINLRADVEGANG